MKKSAKRSRATLIYDLTRSVMSLTDAVRAYHEYDPDIARRIKSLVSKLDMELDLAASLLDKSEFPEED